MKLSEACIRRPVLASMLNLALVAVGLVALTRLPVRELPNVDPPVVSVTTALDGASAEVMESQVTEPLEEAINNIPGIKRLSSTNREEVSEITVEFYLSEDPDVVAQEVRDRVARARPRLPDDVEEPVVTKQQADASPILWIALYSERYSTRDLTELGENVLKERLQTVPGVSSILIGGGKRFAVRLRLDAPRMGARGVTVQDVDAALRRENVELPSGSLENSQREIAVQMRAELSSPEEFNDLIIRFDGDTPIRLRDIGFAEAGVEDERTVARYRSKPAVGLGVIRQSKANTISVADGIRARMKELEPLVPEGVSYFLAYDESIYVKASVTEVAETILISFGLVVLVVFLFLRNVRTTVIPAVAIPVSVVGVFGLLAAFGFSINILTLLALVLSIGVVVDDAIVVLENIYHHVERGKPPFRAAIDGMKEVGFAIVATTLSLVAVFVPLAFQTSVTGRLFTEFAVALAGAVAISAFVALTLSPAMCARWLRPPSGRHNAIYNALERLFNNIESLYRRALGRALRHRLAVGGVAAAATAAGALAFLGLDREFLPEEDKARIFCIVVAPEGASADYTDRYLRRLEAIVAEVPEVDGYFSAVALARGARGQSNQGLMFVRLKDRSDRRRSVQEIVRGARGLGARFFAEAPGVIAIPIIPKTFQRGFGQPLELSLQGRDLVELEAAAREVAARVQSMGTVAGARTSFELTKPELRVRIDRERANALGVSTREVARVLQVMLGGLKLSDFRREGKLYDVIAQLDREDRLTPAAFDNLYVRSRSGSLVQLGNILTFSEAAGPNSISHNNRSRSATIEGTPVGVPLGRAMDQIESLLADVLPPGMTFSWEGEARDLLEAGAGTVAVFLLGLLFVYMVLAAQFESTVHPFTVLLAVPLALVGAFGALRLFAWTDAAGLTSLGAMSLNLTSQVGLVLLIGLVTKNSILLVDFANQRRPFCANAAEAMLEAGTRRLRPILMTALSTVIGILPIAIGWGAGAEGRRPLGIVVIGGMVSSTLLTLFAVPVLYTVLDRFTKHRAPGAEEDGNPLPANP